MTRPFSALFRAGALMRGLLERWRAQGAVRRCELLVWLTVGVACAASSPSKSKDNLVRSPQGFVVGKDGCLVAPSQLLAQWTDLPQRCGLWLIQDPRHVGRLGLLSGKNGSTLAEGRAPKACKGDRCDYSSWSTALGPMVVASLRSGANAGQHWLGVRHGHHLSFVALTPSDAQAEAGEVVGPGAMLEPWRCGANLALRIEPGQRPKDLEEDRQFELIEREGLYVPDGRGWLVVPQKTWDRKHCQRLPLSF